MPRPYSIGVFQCAAQIQAVALIGRDDRREQLDGMGVFVDLNAAEQMRHVVMIRIEVLADRLPHGGRPRLIGAAGEARARHQQAIGVVVRRARRIGDDGDAAEQVSVMLTLGDVLEAVAEGDQVDEVPAPRQLPREVVDDQAVAQIQRIGRAAGDEQDVHANRALIGRLKPGSTSPPSRMSASVRRVMREAVWAITVLRRGFITQTRRTPSARYCATLASTSE